jgi:hypothetical protein
MEHVAGALGQREERRLLLRFLKKEDDDGDERLQRRRMTTLGGAPAGERRESELKLFQLLCLQSRRILTETSR